MNIPGRRFTETYEAGYKVWYQRLKARFPEAPTRRVCRMIRIAKAIKSGRGCLDCGYNGASQALDFDHREPVTKKFNISNPPLDCTIGEFRHEIRKCDVRCSNCHRVVTSKRRIELVNRRSILREQHKAKHAPMLARRTWGDRAEAITDALRKRISESTDRRDHSEEFIRMRDLVVNGMATKGDRERFFELAADHTEMGE